MSARMLRDAPKTAAIYGLLGAWVVDHLRSPTPPGAQSLTLSQVRMALADFRQLATQE